MSEYVYLDGPRFLAWLEERVDLREEINDYKDTLWRRMYEWRAGGRAREDVAEKTLLRFGLHLSQIPEHLYVPKRVKTDRPYSEEVKQTAMKMYRNGYTPMEISRHLGVCTKSIHNWRAKAGVPPLYGVRPGSKKAA